MRGEVGKEKRGGLETMRNGDKKERWNEGERETRRGETMRKDKKIIGKSDEGSRK